MLFAFRLSFSVDLINVKEARKAKKWKIMHFLSSFCTTQGIMFNLELQRRKKKMRQQQWNAP